MAGVRIRPIHGFFFLCEALLILSAVTLAFFIRFQISTWDLFSYPHLLPKMLALVVVTQLCLYYNDLYQFGKAQRLHVLILRIMQAIGAAVILLLALYYAFPGIKIGRGVFFLAMPLVFGMVLGYRVILRSLVEKGRLSRRILVIGSGPKAIELIRYVSDPNRRSFQLAGFLEEDIRHLGPFRAAGRAIGSYKDLFQTVMHQGIELVVVGLDDRRGRLPMAELAECRFHGVEVLESSQFWELEQGVISVQDLRPSWVVFSDGFRQSRLTILVKEVSEVLFSSAVLLASLPIFVAIAIAIRLEGKGPVFYRQTRVGTRGRVFTLLKFRSMRTDAEKNGAAQWAEENDPRVTRVGGFLRKYRLDELPQLINVIRGEMSLVGPRPERPQFVDELMNVIPCYSQRLVVKPGLTGLAQVRHQYGSSVEDAKKKLEYDLYYIKNLSISLDFSILVDTLKVVLLGKGAR